MTSSPSGTPVLVGTSWKMNKTIAEAVAYVDTLLDAGVPSSVDAFILPAHTALAAVRDRLPQDSGIRLGAQNAHWAGEGAGTGEVSMRMVRDAGATLVEIGHSERRGEFGETDETVARKVAAALQHGLTPLVCVGEPRAVRDSGNAETHVAAQVRAALSLVPHAGTDSVVFAYEPVWAIGDAGRPASPEEVAPVVSVIRRAVTETLGSPGTTADQAAGRTCVLYGGSVDEGNAESLLSGSHADGLFIGRAGWSATGFAHILALVGDRSAVGVRLTASTSTPEPHRWGGPR